MKNFKVITYIILMIAFSFSFSSCEKHDDIHYHSDCDIISIMVRANSRKMVLLMMGLYQRMEI